MMIYKMYKWLLSIFIMITLLFCSCGTSSEVTNKTENNSVVIGIIDTGFSNRAISKEYMLEGKNYFDEALSTEDTYGHGTAIASIILEYFSDVRLVPLVSSVFDNGKLLQVEPDVFAQMILDAVDVYHCDIINISAGFMLDSDVVSEAIAYAEQKNVLVVAAAGNTYKSEGAIMYYPAAYETVLAVGSIDTAETEISEFSQRGTWVNLYATGEDVTVRTLSGNTRINSGTSYSAAKITAYAAQLISQAASYLTAQQLRELILEYAYTLPNGAKYISDL